MPRFNYLFIHLKLLSIELGQIDFLILVKTVELQPK